MNELIKFYLNDYIRVKLNDRGRQILLNEHDAVNRWIIGRGGKGLPPRNIEIDHEGYTKFQGWVLMNTFGPFIQAGGELPFEIDILLEVKDAKGFHYTR